MTRDLTKAQRRRFRELAVAAAIRRDALRPGDADEHVLRASIRICSFQRPG
jgi:hypothetical protein